MFPSVCLVSDRWRENDPCVGFRSSQRGIKHLRLLADGQGRLLRNVDPTTRIFSLVCILRDRGEGISFYCLCRGCFRV